LRIPKRRGPPLTAPIALDIGGRTSSRRISPLLAAQKTVHRAVA
jgi:hypothetical protein